MNIKVLFLDDEKSRVEDFEKRTGIKVTHVVNGEDFCKAINEDHFDLIMLDHDLGYGVDYDGARAAKYLAENRSLLGNEQMVLIHSANPIGVANMMNHMKYADHLQVNAINFAWQKACIVDGKLHFRGIFE
jgi:DNA-binding NtrC family response regulator